MERVSISVATRRRIADALAEDVGAGDWTTEWCVGREARGTAEIVAKAAGVIFGLEAAGEVFRYAGEAELRPRVADGGAVEAGTPVAEIVGSARAILTGERTALNFLGRLSGVASLTRRFVAAVEETGAGTRITDTRKTTPLWRELERMATLAGGAVNHRRGLDAMVLIKENHIVSAGGIAAAVSRVDAANRKGLRVEVEARDLDEVREALAAGVDRILLDNMSLATVRESVSLIEAHRSSPEIEVSGGVTLETVGELARTGVDYISVGALTHSAPALDLSLRMLEVDREP